MSIIKEKFGITPDGKEIYSYVLDNEKNIKAEILNYGGIIRSLWIKNKNGEYVDVVLGRDTLEEYLNNEGYFGALIGRHANRIYRGNFTINGSDYNVGINDKGNSLHGGITGFDKYVWNVVELNDEKEPSITLSIVSPDGDEGFPGRLEVFVKYSLNEKNGLEIHYEASTDKDTVVNLTNHSYFNLNGAGNSNVLNHSMKMNCSFYTPNSDECLPYGEILSVKNSPFDFTKEKLIGSDINSCTPQIKMFEGYDHNFVIDGYGFRKAVTLKGNETGISMEVYTDKPGVQLYTGNYIEIDRVCKDGKKYEKYGGLCLETQFFPNSTSFSHFSCPILKKGEKYSYTTEYRFL